MKKIILPILFLICISLHSQNIQIVGDSILPSDPLE